jgi:hypothetical protein
MRIALLLCGALLLALSACDPTSSGGSRDPLDRVVMVVRSSAAEVEERGIQAVPEGNFIRLEWHRTPIDQSAFFQRYQLERTNLFDPVNLIPFGFSVHADNFGYFDTTYVDTTNIVLNNVYYYRVAVINVDDRASEYSDTVFFQLGPKPGVVADPASTDSTLDFIFTVDLNNSSIPEPVYLRIFTGTEALLIADLPMSPLYEGNGKGQYLLSQLVDIHSGKGVDVFQPPRDAEAIALTRGANYFFRLDYVGSLVDNVDNSGSSGAKSQWRSFTYSPN